MIPFSSIHHFWKVWKSRLRGNPNVQRGHQPGLRIATHSILHCFCDLKGHLSPLWSWWPITLPKEVFFFCLGLVQSYIHLGSPCRQAARLEQCWVCIYRLESFSFWLCLLHFKESRQCVTMTAFLDGFINKVTSTFTTWNKPRIAEGKIFQIVSALFKETLKSE